MPPEPRPPSPRAPQAARQFLRFLAVGPVGMALGAVQYELLWRLNPLDTVRAGSTWVVSSLLGVAWVHALHQRVTFRGSARRGWRETVGRAYALYAGSIALGTALMHGLVDELALPRTPAWLATTALTSLLNFVVLRRLLGADVPREGAGDAAAGGRAGAGGIALHDLTVVVPTKDEARNVGAFLRSLPPEVALIVVDASRDGTRDRIRALRPARTRIIDCPGDIPRARQRGAEHASTPWLLFTDVDVSFADDYFARLAARPVDARCAGLVGTKRSRDRFRGYHALFTAGQRLCAWVGIPAATGSNMLLRRDALLACGGFDPALRVNEDSEVMWRCQRAGHAVRFAPELVVFSRDHRRLERGVARKLLHTAARCVALYLGVLPARWRAADWGYWAPVAPPREVPAER